MAGCSLIRLLLRPRCLLVTGTAGPVNAPSPASSSHFELRVAALLLDSGATMPPCFKRSPPIAVTLIGLLLACLARIGAAQPLEGGPVGGGPVGAGVPIGGEPVYGGPAWDPPIGGEPVYGEPVEEGEPIGGPSVYGGPLWDPPIGGEPVYGDTGEDDEPIEGQPLY